jgi:hypothetical protein
MSNAKALRKLGPALLILIWPIAAGWLSWKVIKFVARILGLATGTMAVALPPLTVGRFRHTAAPLWVWLAGLAGLAVPGATWIWIAATTALMLASTRGREDQDETEQDGAGGRRYLSAREMRIAGRTFAGIAAAIGIGAPWLAEVAGISASVAVGAIFWWRDVSAPPVQLSAFEQQWYDLVAHPHPDMPSRIPQLEGWFKEWDDEAGRGIYELAHSDAWAVSGMDDKVELAFDQPPGTISLSPDPRLSRRLLRITASDPSVGGRLRMFDGYSLRKDGSFIVGYTKGGVPIYGKLWGSGGGIYITIIAPPNMGKGSLLRLIAVEGAACPDLLQIGCDGKRGGGMGYMRDAFWKLSTDHDESVDLIHGYLLAARERAERYGQAGEDGYMVRHLDPRMNLVIDEIKWILRHDSRVAGWLLEISGISRFVGMSVTITVHKADAAGYGDTETRSNFMTNGWRAMGPAVEQQARGAGLQGADFDPSTLPDDPGWFGLIGRMLAGRPTPVRTLWLPNDLDVERALGDDVTGLVTELDVAPFGTVQQWLKRDAVHPELHPATLEALLRPARERIERAEAAAKAEQDQADAAAAEGPAPSDGWSRIQAVLRANPDGLIRIEIATAAGLSRGHTSELLRIRSENGDVVQNKNKTWRLAA